MNAPHTLRALGRSIGALAAGFFVTAALSLGTDVVMHGTGVAGIVASNAANLRVDFLMRFSAS